MKPNDASLGIHGCDVVTMRDGRLAGIPAYVNRLRACRQGRALPPQGSAAENAITAALNLETRGLKFLRR